MIRRAYLLQQAEEEAGAAEAGAAAGLAEASLRRSRRQARLESGGRKQLNTLIPRRARPEAVGGAAAPPTAAAEAEAEAVAAAERRRGAGGGGRGGGGGEEAAAAAAAERRHRPSIFRPPSIDDVRIAEGGGECGASRGGARAAGRRRRAKRAAEEAAAARRERGVEEVRRRRRPAVRPSVDGRSSLWDSVASLPAGLPPIDLAVSPPERRPAAGRGAPAPPSWTPRPSVCASTLSRRWPSLFRLGAPLAAGHAAPRRIDGIGADPLPPSAPPPPADSIVRGWQWGSTAAAAA